MIGRRVQIQYKFGTGLCRIAHRPGLPDVLTHGQANPYTLNLHDAGAVTALEIAHFVEYLVVGQALFTVLGNNLAVVQHSGDVIKGNAFPARVADNQPGVTGHRRLDRLQRLVHTQFNARAQQQVFRGIAAERELGEHQHRRSDFRLRAPHGFNDLGGIALKVTHEGVHLHHDNIQAGHRDSALAEKKAVFSGKAAPAARPAQELLAHRSGTAAPRYLRAGAVTLAAPTDSGQLAA